MRRKSISFVIAYLLLLIAAFVADAILVVSFTGFLSKTSTEAPRIVEQFTSGLVYGAYSIAPYVREITTGSQVYTQIITGLHVVLLNPNPSPTDVVLIGHYPTAVSTYKVLDLVGTLGIEWDGGSPPEGVEIIDINKFPWFQSENIYRGLRLMPHAVASFTIPAYYGVPESVLACTRIGCVKLEYVGMQPGIETGSSPWIIQRTGKDSLNATVMQTWGWEAATLGGSQRWCVADMLNYGKMTIVYTGVTVDCCIPCPPGSHPTDDKIADRGVCSTEKGSMLSFSAVRGMPGNVIMGYYTTDPLFSFKTPTTIRIGGHTYHLYGFDSSKTSLDLNQEKDVVSAWANYENQDCFVRVVNITAIMLSRGRENNLIPLSELWPSSSTAYIYVAAKGRSTDFAWMYEHDYVTVRVYGIKKDGSLVPIGEALVAKNGFVDNSAELRNEPGKWAFNPSKYVGLEVKITYIMEGPKTEVWGCFFLGYCGYTQPERKVRLAFYVEIIPSEFLS